MLVVRNVTVVKTSNLEGETSNL